MNTTPSVRSLAMADEASVWRVRGVNVLLTDIVLLGNAQNQATASSSSSLWARARRSRRHGLSARVPNGSSNFSRKGRVKST